MNKKGLLGWIIVGIVVILVIGLFLFYIISPSDSSNSNNFDDDSSSVTCSSNVYNCDDFTVCEDVMEVFNDCKDRGFGDIHSLDRDENGVPCESLCG